MRLFIAINLPESWQDVLLEPRKSIEWLGKGIRWVELRGMHLTLKFLGDTSPRQLEEIKALLPPLVAEFEPFEMQISNTGVFPNPRRPRVYWAGVKAPQMLQHLQEKIEAAMESMGFEPEERPFHPHLTVARIKEPIGKKRSTDAFLKFHLRSDPFRVEKVSLMRSHLSREGARYEELAAFPLQIITSIET
jgi:2'-5' RNA ligase